MRIIGDVFLKQLLVVRGKLTMARTNLFINRV
jgi:hypothetical protein